MGRCKMHRGWFPVGDIPINNLGKFLKVAALCRSRTGPDRAIKFNLIVRSNPRACKPSLKADGFQFSKGENDMDQIVLPTGPAGRKARRLLRKHIKMLDQVAGSSTDPLCEKVVCERLLEVGKVDSSFIGQAKDMRRAFVAIRRLLQ